MDDTQITYMTSEHAQINMPKVLAILSFGEVSFHITKKPNFLFRFFLRLLGIQVELCKP